MGSARVRSHGCRYATSLGKAGRVSGLVSGTIALVLAGAVPAGTAAQQPAAAVALVFDGVTVVDVEHGKLVPDQRVVIAGNRIQTVGPVGAVKLPKGGQVVDARGKYLIPGLWDLHVHTLSDFVYPLLLASGVTGMRDAFASVPLDTMIQWRREILAGTRMGPPRQILSGAALDERASCQREEIWRLHTCVTADDSADVSAVVGALQAAGADMIKMYSLHASTYFMVGAEARRRGIPFGGHVYGSRGLTPDGVSDSGARIIDHVVNSGGMQRFCWGKAASIIEKCQPVAERLQRNNTWLVPTLVRTAKDSAPEQVGAAGVRSRPILVRLREQGRQFFGAGSLLHGNWLGGSGGVVISPDVDSIGVMHLMQRVGMPILAGTDAPGTNLKEMESVLPGFVLHAELAMYVAEGLTPLNALQTATLNPAKMLRATDSLGTVAPGKLADLVLLDADPLADITNTTTVHAVVANGRYFDRAALDQLLVQVQAAAKQGFRYWYYQGRTAETWKIEAAP